VPKASPAGERELRTQGKRTMANLLDAGMGVLRDKGYHAARVDDIVKEAKVSHGTFYLYFSNKQDLLRAMALRCADEMLRVIEALGPVGPDEDGLLELRSWLADFLEGYRRYGVVIRAWMEDTVADKELVRLGGDTFGSVTSSLVERIRDADPPNVDDPELAAAAMLALIERFTYFLTSRDLPFDDDDVLDTLAILVHRGFFAGQVDRPKVRLGKR
jgi:AcrR family transcriptional regulator